MDVGGITPWMKGSNSFEKKKLYITSYFARSDGFQIFATLNFPTWESSNQFHFIPKSPPPPPTLVDNRLHVTNFERFSAAGSKISEFNLTTAQTRVRRSAKDVNKLGGGRGMAQ